MTFQQIWDQLVIKQPRLADRSAKVEFSSDNLKTLLRQVYEQGEKQARPTPPSSSLGDWFGGLR